MPYRIKKGQEILVVYKDEISRGRPRTERKDINRELEFPKQRLIASPLDEHLNDGIGRGPYATEFPWGFDARKLWDDGKDVVSIFAKEVHMVDRGTASKAQTVVVKGSSGTPYTLTLNKNDEAIHCTCPAFRFSRTTCKHIQEYNR